MFKATAITQVFAGVYHHSGFFMIKNLLLPQQVLNASNKDKVIADKVASSEFRVNKPLYKAAKANVAI